jgi:hypothetical protein
LNASISSVITDLQFHIEGIETFETTPFPIPPLFNNNSLSIISKLPTQFQNNSILCSGYFDNESMDLNINVFRSNQFKAAKALFSFNMMKELSHILTMKRKNSEDIQGIKNKLIQLSLESGILCEFTAFIGVSELPQRFDYYCECAAPQFSGFGLMGCSASPRFDSRCECAAPQLNDLCYCGCDASPRKKSSFSIPNPFPSLIEGVGSLFTDIGSFFSRKKGTKKNCLLLLLQKIHLLRF